MSSSFLSHSHSIFTTPKSTQITPSPPPSSVKFRHSPPISTFYTAQTTTTTLHISSPPSMYDILGIQTNASFQEIKSAYRKLARVSHPDVSQNYDSLSADVFIRIQAAYATLSDPQKRADYDRTLMPARRRGSASSTMATPSCTGVSGYTGRSWETDQCW